MNIVVIIPTYNEAENIGRMLDVLVGEEFPKIKKHTMKVLVVDDNSPDGTAKIVRAKMKKYKNIELLLGQKEGLGRAFARGMQYAMKTMKADAVVEMDADFQHDPKDVKRLVAAFDEGYDYVIGSRYVGGGSIPKEWKFYRKFLSAAGNIFGRVALLMPFVHDTTSGFKLTRVKGFLDHVDLNNLLSKSYAYKLHILYEVIKVRGARIKEVPINFHFRERGSSKIEHEDIFESFKVVILLFFRTRFFKFATVGTIGFAVNSISLEIFKTYASFPQNIAFNFAYLSGSWLAILSHPTSWSAAAAAEVAILSNFTLNNFWTFEEARITYPPRLLWKFLQFNLTSAGAILIQFVVVGTSAIIFGDTRLVRQISLVVAVIFFIVPYNYTMYNIFIWKRWKIKGLGWFQNKTWLKEPDKTSRLREELQ